MRDTEQRARRPAGKASTRWKGEHPTARKVRESLRQLCPLVAAMPTPCTNRSITGSFVQMKAQAGTCLTVKLLTRATLDARWAMERSLQRSAILTCTTSNRVALLFKARRVWQAGVPAALCRPGHGAHHSSPALCRTPLGALRSRGARGAPCGPRQRDLQTRAKHPGSLESSSLPPRGRGSRAAAFEPCRGGTTVRMRRPAPQRSLAASPAMNATAASSSGRRYSNRD